MSSFCCLYYLKKLIVTYLIYHPWWSLVKVSFVKTDCLGLGFILCTIIDIYLSALSLCWRPTSSGLLSRKRCNNFVFWGQNLRS